MLPGSTAGERFCAYDDELHRASCGPTWLKNPAVASAVVRALLLAATDWSLCDLAAWVVMANHVHVLVVPKKPIREVTRAVKSASARAANLILGRTGLPFWQDESYDHWVRNGDEFNRIVKYIERNPVKAGLVDRVEQWQWSSAWGGQVGDLPHVGPHGV
jgi:REP element-mobilizing transposase RayT